MREQNWTDAEIIGAITGSESERARALNLIFQQQTWNNMIVRYIEQHGGSTQDGEDVFQETLILFDRSIRKGNFKGKSSLKTYFFAIAKYYWWKLRSRRRPTRELSPQDYDETIDSVEVHVLEEEKKQYLRQAMQQIGDRCKAILRLYQLDYSMQEIARDIGLSSDAMAKKETYRCRMRLRAYLENNPDWKTLQH